MTAVIIQARYNSTRLRGKVLKKVDNKTLLSHLYDRVKKSKKIKNIIVATSNHLYDKKIVNYCKKKKIPVFCGPLKNVYSRILKLVIKRKITKFIRISADSPLMDHKIIDRAIMISNKNPSIDVVTNVFPRTYPKGHSVELIKTSAFKKLKSFSMTPHDKEHVTTAIYKNNHFFKIKNFRNKKNQSNVSLAIDTKQDFKRLYQKIKNND